MTETIVDRIFARATEQPDHPAVIHQSGRAWTYGDLRENVRDRSQLLRAEYDLPQGARCGLVTDDDRQFLLDALAILHAGYCLLPVPEDFAGKGLAEFRDRTQLHCLLDDRESLQSTVYEDPDPVDENGDEEFQALDPAYVRFTSGTTGRRKGVLLSHESILNRTALVNESLEVSPEDRILWLLDMQEHFISSVLLYLRNGATILLPDDHLPNTVGTLIENERATFLYSTPYQYELLLGVPGTSMESVRLAISTASGLSESTATKFEDAFNRPLTQALGIIEVGLPMINLERASDKPMSLGQVQSGYDVRLKSESELIATGAGAGPGELQVKGEGFFDAYLSPWVPADEVLEDGYFRSGDQGYFDEDGDFFLQGRQHNRINMAGMKFFCEEVEEVLNKHETVAESRVLGQNHDKLGEIPIAEVVLVDDASLDAEGLKAHCRSELASHKVPREFEPVDSIPRTDTGKIKRAKSDE